MSRSFDFATGPNYAITGAGSVGAVGNGAYTIVVLFNITGNAGLIAFRATGVNAQLIVDTNQLFGAGDFQGGQTGVTTNTWWWAAIRKAAGSSVYSYSLRAYNSGSTTHQSGSVNHADSGVANTSVRLGDGDDRGNGLIAVWAAWTSSLSDAQVAGMFTTAAADVAAQSPQALWLGNQASSTDPIPDSTGNGAGSTSFNGTVGIGADPPSYNYSLAAAQTSARQQIVMTAQQPVAVVRPMLLRNTAALIVAPAKASAPVVVGQPIPAPQGAAILRRGTLADPPALTTPRPIVTTQPASASPIPAILLRSSLADAVQPSTATPPPRVVTAQQPSLFSAPILTRNPAAPPPGVQPEVITAPAVAGASAPIILRSSLADAPVLTTPAPLVVTASVPGPAGAATFVRNPQAPAAAPAASTPSPIVITVAVAPAPGQALVTRGSLADAPVLTTVPPTVVTARPPRPDSLTIVIRNPQPAAVQPTAAMAGPIVVTATQPASVSRPILSRGSLADVFYAGTAPIVVTRAATARTATALVLAAPQFVAAPTGTSSPNAELVTRSGATDLTTSGPAGSLPTLTTIRDLVTQTSGRDLEV